MLCFIKNNNNVKLTLFDLFDHSNIIFLLLMYQHLRHIKNNFHYKVGIIIIFN